MVLTQKLIWEFREKIQGKCHLLTELFTGHIGSKSKNQEVEWHQTQKFLQSKGNHQVKKQAMEWEKIFAKCRSDRRLLSEKYKEILQLNSKETTQFKN